MKVCLVAGAALLPCGGAIGQTNARLHFEFDRHVVSPSSPVTTVTVYGAWDYAASPPDPSSFVFGFVDYDLFADSGRFVSSVLILGAAPPNTAGIAEDLRVRGAAIGQVHFPPLPLLSNWENPIALAEYTWTTTDFRPREVGFVSERTSSFVLWPFSGGLSIELWPSQFTPASSSITVLPSPGALLVLAGCGLLMIGRRRRAECSMHR